MRRFGFDLRSEPPDVRVDEATVAEVLVAPHTLEERLSAQHHPLVPSELAQEEELSPRQRDRHTGTPNDSRTDVHLEAPTRYTVGSASDPSRMRPLDPSKQGTDTSGELLHDEWFRT